MSNSRRTPEQILERLEWTVIRRLDGLLQGDYRTFFRGFGLDLADLREYQFNDDVRYIDWNVTARLDTPYVRQYNEDREITAWFLLDVSPSVDFGSGDRNKRSMLVGFVGSLARLLTRHGNRTGAILYSGNVDRIIPARGGRNHVLYILNELVARPELKSSPPTDLKELLVTAFRAIPRRSLIFVVSDFFSTPGWAQPLAHLSMRHEVLAVRLYDPLEMELPNLGYIAIEDAESGEQISVDTSDARFRARFEAEAERNEEEVRSALVRSGVDALELSTGDDLVESLLRFAAMRKQRSLMAGGASASTAVGRHI